ncbi:MAG: S41 family peptidase [Candidatus Sulfotelmatobacter sp.]
MLRSLYGCLLRLHPPGFRRRFGDEMLSIFDQSAGKAATFKLLGDGLLSLARQWGLRSEFWHASSSVPAQQPASDGIPSFATIDPFRPRTAAVIHGLVLSTAVFCLTCFAIRYSWIHVLHVRIPEMQFESTPVIEPSAGASAMPEEPVVPSHQETRANSDAPGSDRVASSAGNNVPSAPPAASLPQNETPGTTPAPPGRAGNAPVRAVRAAVAAKNLAVQSPATANFKSDEASGASAGPESQGAAATMPPAPVEGMKIPEVKIDAAERRRVVDGAIANLEKYYVDPDVAHRMANSLQAHEKRVDDDAAMGGAAFADLLTSQMRNVSHDRYVTMVYGTAKTPDNPPAPTSEEMARYRKEMEAKNCSFEKVSILPHNIGYLKFNSFPDAEICGPTAAAAMAKLNQGDAIIFDLRDNPGGYSNMVALIATYLFDRPTHLNDFYNRGDNTTEQSWTLAPVAGNKLVDKPAFVLTSASTFSAAEGFSYDLKMLKRATLVGETTSGRGHMGMGHRIDDHFTIRVPGIRVVNPISKTNWEGVGVEPDVKVKAADALATAEKLAEKELARK